MAFNWWTSEKRKKPLCVSWRAEVTSFSLTNVPEASSLRYVEAFRVRPGRQHLIWHPVGLFAPVFLTNGVKHQELYLVSYDHRKSESWTLCCKVSLRVKEVDSTMLKKSVKEKLCGRGSTQTEQCNMFISPYSFPNPWGTGPSFFYFWGVLKRSLSETNLYSSVNCAAAHLTMRPCEGAAPECSVDVRLP